MKCVVFPFGHSFQVLQQVVPTMESRHDRAYCQPKFCGSPNARELIYHYVCFHKMGGLSQYVPDTVLDYSAQIASNLSALFAGLTSGESKS